MTLVILIDSDVLIWLTRGQRGAKTRLSKIDPWRISAITYMEIAQGCRSKDELQRAKRGLERKGAEIFPLTPSISERAMHLIDTHALPEGLQVADALIAATAIEHRFVLLTGNTKHFATIDGLKIERFEP